MPRQNVISTSDVEKAMKQLLLDKNLPSYDKVFECLGDVLEDIPLDDKRWKDIGPKLKRQEKNLSEGRNFKLSKISPEDKHTGVFTRGMAKDRISDPHLVSPCGKKVRLLTKNEVSRCQNVPENLVHGVSNTTALEILGQGISFNHGKGLAELIAQEILLPLSNPEHISPILENAEYEIEIDSIDGIERIAPVAATNETENQLSLSF